VVRKTGVRYCASNGIENENAEEMEAYQKFGGTCSEDFPSRSTLNTICSLRGSGQASSRWKMDAQLLFRFSFKAAFILHVMYHLMLQCETRIVKISLAERFSHSKDGVLQDR
jgi:hypothetical protein